MCFSVLSHAMTRPKQKLPGKGACPGSLRSIYSFPRPSQRLPSGPKGSHPYTSLHLPWFLSQAWCQKWSNSSPAGSSGFPPVTWQRVFGHLGHVEPKGSHNWARGWGNVTSSSETAVQRAAAFPGHPTLNPYSCSLSNRRMILYMGWEEGGGGHGLRSTTDGAQGVRSGEYSTQGRWQGHPPT